MKLFFSDSKVKYRQTHLLHIYVRHYLGKSSLSDYQEFFENHSRMASCFTDLQRRIEDLDAADTKKFEVFMASCLKQEHFDSSASTEVCFHGHKPTDQLTCTNQGDSSKWLPLINMSKFAYLFHISRAASPSRHTIEDQFLRNIQLWICCKDVDVGCQYFLFLFDHMSMD